MFVHGVWTGKGEMPPCEGALIKAHLIKAQTIRRELGLAKNDRRIWDPAVWVWCCGGPLASVGYGAGGHHGAMDSARTLRIPRSAIPKATERWAQVNGLSWYLDREFPD